MRGYLQAVRSAPKKVLVGTKITKKGREVMARTTWPKKGLPKEEMLVKGFMKNIYRLNPNSVVIKQIKHV